MRRSPHHSLLVALAAVALAGCGMDPCGAARQWASTCNFKVTSETEFRQSCEQAMSSCTDSQKGEVASFYQCMAGNKLCTGLDTGRCAENVTLGAANCINTFK